MNRSCGPEGAGSQTAPCLRVSQVILVLAAHELQDWRDHGEQPRFSTVRAMRGPWGGPWGKVQPQRRWRPRIGGSHRERLRPDNMWQGRSPWKWPKEASVKVQTQLQRIILEPRGLWADYPDQHQVWDGAGPSLQGKLCVLWWQSQRSVAAQAL